MLSVTSKLVVTGCCSCTATYSISARKSAAPLIGQFFMSHCMLLLAQETPDQHFVHRVLPIGGADDALHDHAVTVDQIALRHAKDVVRLSDVSARVVQDVECESQAIRERHDLFGTSLFLRIERVAIHAHRRDPEVG